MISKCYNKLYTTINWVYNLLFYNFIFILICKRLLMKILEPFKIILEHSNIDIEFPYHTIACYGSRSSGKTQNVIRTTLAHMLQCSDDILILRYIQVSIKQSSYSNIVQIINEEGLNDYFTITTTYIQSKVTGARLEFRGIYSQGESLKSLSPNFKIIIIEECSNVPMDDWNILLPTVYRFDRVLVIPIFNTSIVSNPTYKLFVNQNNKRIKEIYINADDLDEVGLLSNNMKELREKHKQQMTTNEYNMHWLGIWQQSLANAIFNDECLNILCSTPYTYSLNDKITDKIIISYDPAITSKNGVDIERESDAQGISVLQYTTNGNINILELHNEILSPDKAVKLLIKLYKRYKAEYILYESNQGGDFIKSLILSNDKTILTKEYRSTQSKEKRAAMIVSSIFNNKIKLLDIENKNTLIDQMMNMTMSGYVIKDRSPDLLDSVVMGCIDLLNLNNKETINLYTPIIKNDNVDEYYIKDTFMIYYVISNIAHVITGYIREGFNRKIIEFNTYETININTFNINDYKDITKLIYNYKFNNIDSIERKKKIYIEDLPSNKHTDDNLIILNIIESIRNKSHIVNIYNDVLLDAYNSYTPEKDENILLQLIMYMYY